MPAKTKVFIAIDVREGELPKTECCMITKNGTMLVGYANIDSDGDVEAVDENQTLPFITHWLKEQEGYFFTLEQLKEEIVNAFDSGRNYEYEKHFGKIPKTKKNKDEYIAKLIEEKQ